MSDDTIRQDTAGAAGSQPDSAQPPTQRYDFRAAQRLSTSHFAQLHPMNEQFCREFPASLSAMLRKKTSASITSCEYVERLTESSLPEAALAVLLDVHPPATTTVLAMNADLVFALFEVLLGGGSNETKFDRGPTDLELSVLQGIWELATRQLETAWHKKKQYRFEAVAQLTELKPQNLSPLADGFVQLEIEMRIESNAGRLFLLYPARMVKSLVDGDAPAKALQSLSPEQQVFRQLKAAGLSVEGCLQGATLKLADLVDLQVNDLVCLDVPLERPLSILINGKPRFLGQLFQRGRKRSVRVNAVRLPAKDSPGAVEAETP